MKAIKIIMHIAILYALLLIGNWIQEALQLFIPGSVIGMLLLFLLLKSKVLKLVWIADGTQLILRHLTLFFIPVTVGFINYPEFFSSRGLILFIITVISTMLVMGLSGAVSQGLARRKETQHD